MANKKKPLKKVSEKRKVFLKKNHTKLLPENLKPNERLIYNRRKAGLIRQKEAIKDSKGKFVSKYFINELTRLKLAENKVNTSKLFSGDNKKFDEIRKNAGVTNKELKDFYDKNPDLYNDIIKTGGLTISSKNTIQLIEFIEEFKRKIIVDTGTEKITLQKNDVLKLIDEFKQFVTSIANVVNITWFPELSFDGNITLQIPSLSLYESETKKILKVKNLDDTEELESSEFSEALRDALKNIYGKKLQIILHIS